MGINVSIFIMLAMIFGPFVLRLIMRPKYQNEPMIDNTTSSDIVMPEECGSHTNLDYETNDMIVQSVESVSSDSVSTDCVDDLCLDVDDDFYFDLKNAIIAQTILQNHYIE